MTEQAVMQTPRPLLHAMIAGGIAAMVNGDAKRETRGGIASDSEGIASYKQQSATVSHPRYGVLAGLAQAVGHRSAHSWGGGDG